MKQSGEARIEVTGAGSTGPVASADGSSRPEPHMVSLTANADVALLRKAAAGSVEDLRVLMDEVLPSIYGRVFASVGGGQAADDIIQETLIEALRSANTFRGQAALTTWLHAIAKRRLARHFAKERRWEAAAPWLAPSFSDPEGDIDRRDMVVRALGTVSPSYRQVLVLKYIEELSVEQIAHELGRSRIQVQSLLQRARAAFRSTLVVDGSAVG